MKNIQRNIRNITYQDIKIIYEDNHVLVALKPAGVLSQEDRSGKPDMLTLLKHYLKETYNKPGNIYLGLIHRLDQPVGGVMVFAKTSKAASRLAKQMREREINKYYYAVVHGKFLEDKAHWKNYLSKTLVAKKVEVSDQEKAGFYPAELICSGLQYSESFDVSLLTIHLLSGRRHQIRVQSSLRQHPIVGDRRYGLDNELDLKMKSILLFAYQLNFLHPVTKEKLQFSAPLPDEMVDLGFHNETPKNT